MKELISGFPRQIAFPDRKLIQTESEFWKEVNQYNGIKNIYYSLYKIDGGKWYDFDKLFLDFDGDTALEDTLKLHKHLEEEGYKHLVLFSGKKGFHLYIFLTNYENIKDGKSVLKNISEFFISKLNITPDPSVIGDIARIARVPNSFHIAGKRYCIPLTSYDLEQGLAHIKDKAKEQIFKFEFYGNKLLDIEPFNYENKTFKNIYSTYPELKKDIEVNDKLIEDFPNFFKMILTIPAKATYDNRYWFAVFCREKGLHPNICDKMAKKYWGTIKEKAGRRTKYEEFKAEALKYAYKDNRFLPNWIINTFNEKQKKEIYKELK